MSEGFSLHRLRLSHNPHRRYSAYYDAAGRLIDAESYDIRGINRKVSSVAKTATRVRDDLATIGAAEAQRIALKLDRTPDAV